MKARTTRAACSAAALATILWMAPLAGAQEQSQASEAGSDFGVGVIAALSNVIYMPVKVGYAVLGGVTGTLAYGLTGGNREVADNIWVPSMGGDYVLTADMMKGEQDVRFSGVRSGAAPARETSQLVDDSAAPSSAGGDTEEDEGEPESSPDAKGGTVF